MMSVSSTPPSTSPNSPNDMVPLHPSATPITIEQQQQQPGDVPLISLGQLSSSSTDEYGSPHCSYPSPPLLPAPPLTSLRPSDHQSLSTRGIRLPLVESPEIPLISSEVQPQFSPSTKLRRKRNQNRYAVAKHRAQSRTNNRTVELKLKENRKNISQTVCSGGRDQMPPEAQI